MKGGSEYETPKVIKISRCIQRLSLLLSASDGKEPMIVEDDGEEYRVRTEAEVNAG